MYVSEYHSEVKTSFKAIIWKGERKLNFVPSMILEAVAASDCELLKFLKSSKFDNYIFFFTHDQRMIKIMVELQFIKL